MRGVGAVRNSCRYTHTARSKKNLPARSAVKRQGRLQGVHSVDTTTWGAFDGGIGVASNLYRVRNEICFVVTWRSTQIPIRMYAAAHTCLTGEDTSSAFPDGRWSLVCCPSQTANSISISRQSRTTRLSDLRGELQHLDATIDHSDREQLAIWAESSAARNHAQRTDSDRLWGKGRRTQDFIHTPT